MDTIKLHQDRLFTAMATNSVAIIEGAAIKYRSNDVEYRFKQDSNFFYLTAWPDPGAVAVFSNIDGKKNYQLFISLVDAKAAIWHGPKLDCKDAVENFGADGAYPLEKLDNSLSELLSRADHLYCSFGASKTIKSKIFTCRNRLRDSFPKIIYDLDKTVYELRCVKSPSEISKLRKAIEISALAHNHVMQYVINNYSKNINERDVQAEFYSYCLHAGAEDMAYQPIVAGGSNACTLHYVNNDQLLRPGELLLIDAGAEYQGYAADITRTFPINGGFTSRQAELYQLVLLAQQSAINKVQVGVAWDELQRVIVSTLVDGLLQLKILSGTIDQHIEQKTYLNFYMHSSGHFLGLDVHDPSNYKLNRSIYRDLEENMVLTIEPGLYIPAKSDVAGEWQGIGIRIEDDILVTRDGAEVLSCQAIKEISQIVDLAKS